MSLYTTITHLYADNATWSKPAAANFVQAVITCQGGGGAGGTAAGYGGGGGGSSAFAASCIAVGGGGGSGHGAGGGAPSGSAGGAGGNSTSGNGGSGAGGDAATVTILAASLPASATVKVGRGGRAAGPGIGGAGLYAGGSANGTAAGGGGGSTGVGANASGSTGGSGGSGGSVGDTINGGAAGSVGGNGGTAGGGGLGGVAGSPATHGQQGSGGGTDLAGASYAGDGGDGFVQVVEYYSIPFAAAGSVALNVDRGDGTLGTATLTAQNVADAVSGTVPTGKTNAFGARIPDAVAGAANALPIVGSKMDLVDAPNATAVASIKTNLGKIAATLGSTDYAGNTPQTADVGGDAVQAAVAAEAVSQFAKSGRVLYVVQEP